MTGPNDSAMDITEFLAARIRETETPLRLIVSRQDAYRRRDVDSMDGGWNTWGNYGQLIRQVFRPELMLAELEAKRERIALHTFTPAPEMWRPLPEELPEGFVGDFIGWCDLCSYPGFSYEPWPCPSLRLEAAPYINRADFELGWRMA